VTDRPTADHATRSATVGRIYIRSTAMRPIANNWQRSVVGVSWTENVTNDEVERITGQKACWLYSVGCAVMVVPYMRSKRFLHLRENRDF